MAPVSKLSVGGYTLLPITVLLAGTIIASSSMAGCAFRGSDAVASSKKDPAQGPASETLIRRPISDIPQIKKLVDSAIEQTRQTGWRTR